ncbi:hypothetical protein JTE90_021692 [Oedothorax gibbosus]|uniref:Uncharacterized protein n=1 Tax=Oedothorax gibbosus TaxID=931172 RepID=A0AAV6TUK0_9ARAC|nr:hypothetical protein JTE90_021692 [Oedothorax gibbosus]
MINSGLIQVTTVVSIEHHSLGISHINQNGGRKFARKACNSRGRNPATLSDTVRALCSKMERIQHYNPTHRVPNTEAAKQKAECSSKPAAHGYRTASKIPME